MRSPSSDALPYAVFAHAPADTPRLLPLIQKLEQRVRLWYDTATCQEQIFPEEYAMRMKDSRIVLLVLTESGFSSQHLRSVAAFCVNENIPLLPVIMDDMVLTPGLELMLHRRAYLFREHYATEEDFLNALCRMPWVEDCVLPTE